MCSHGEAIKKAHADGTEHPVVRMEFGLEGGVRGLGAVRAIIVKAGLLGTSQSGMIDQLSHVAIEEGVPELVWLGDTAWFAVCDSSGSSIIG